MKSSSDEKQTEKSLIYKIKLNDLIGNNNFKKKFLPRAVLIFLIFTLAIGFVFFNLFIIHSNHNLSNDNTCINTVSTVLL